MNTDKIQDVNQKFQPHRFSVAPMLDWTDRHCRYFHRLLTKQAMLYTEMVTTGAIIYGKGNYLDYNQQEHPVALQLGGADISDLNVCAQKAADYGYDEINLNVGCPSNRVQNGRFGACLMKDADLVAHAVSSMQQQVNIPVTVKCRIGVDEFDSYEFLVHFVSKIVDSGCKQVIVHARKAWLKGLSPKQNREIPPLDYQRVYQLKQDFPELIVSINGGIHSLDEAVEHLNYVDGVMIGRMAYQSPFMLGLVDQRIFGDNYPPLTATEVVVAMFPYIEQHLTQGGHLNQVTRHMLGIFQGVAGAKQWRRYLSEHAHLKGAGIEVLEQALLKVNPKF